MSTDFSHRPAGVRGFFSKLSAALFSGESVPQSVEEMHLSAIQARALTVPQVITLYLEQVDQSLSKKGLGDREKLLRQFAEHMGGRLVADVKAIELLWWVNSHQGWKSSWTKRRVIITIKTAFNWALKYGLIPGNPFAPIQHEMGEVGRATTADEFQAVLRKMTPAYRRVYVFLRFSGVRPGELCALEWSFLDTGKGIFILRKHKTAKKAKKPRIIVLNQITMRLIAWIRRHDPHPQFVFVNTEGKPWKRHSLDKRFREIRRSLGLPKDLKLYGNRHFFGSNCVLKGVDLLTVSKLLGHSNTTTTQNHYVHIDGEIGFLRAGSDKAFNAATKEPDTKALEGIAQPEPPRGKVSPGA